MQAKFIIYSIPFFVDILTKKGVDYVNQMNIIRYLVVFICKILKKSSIVLAKFSYIFMHAMIDFIFFR